MRIYVLIAAIWFELHIQPFFQVKAFVISVLGNSIGGV
jgi:hypothetical protein